MSIKGAIAQVLRLPAGRRFEQATWKPQAAQWRKLQEILKNNAQTEFGRQHHFAKIGSVKEYQEAVPIRNYDGFRPWIDRMLQGEINLLTYQEPIYYCVTSGSSGTPKPSPITPDYRDEYQSVVHAFLYYLYKEHPKAFNAKALYFNGSAQKSVSPSGVDCGTMSGFNSKNLPPLLKRFYAVPYEGMIIHNTEARYFCAALLALAQPISMMIAITPSPLIMMCQVINQDAERLLKHLADGSLPEDLVLSSEERTLIECLHQAQPERARQLDKLLERDGALSAPKIWPDLDLLVCWKSSTAGSLIPELEKHIPGITIRDAVYSATEGWCNVPYTDACIGGPLAVQAHFYEFIEVGGDESVKEVHELEAGKQYRIIYTTSGGMYRYDIGDVLQVSHFYHNTPSVFFVRKTQQASNLSGEQLTAEQVINAVTAISQQHNLIIPFYVLVPQPESYPPHYDFYVELPQESGFQAAEICQELDQFLRQNNAEYTNSRNSGQLAAPQAIGLAPGSFQLWREQKMAAGADDAQIKPPVLLLTDESLKDLPALP